MLNLKKLMLVSSLVIISPIAVFASGWSSTVFNNTNKPIYVYNNGIGQGGYILPGQSKPINVSYGTKMYCAQYSGGNHPYCLQERRDFYSSWTIKYKYKGYSPTNAPKISTINLSQWTNGSTVPSIQTKPSVKNYTNQYYTVATIDGDSQINLSVRSHL